MKNISVIIPAKIRTPQEAEWLKEALASIPPNTAIVVINDHSPIPWRDVKSVVDFGDARVRELPEGKKGLAAARNAAMKLVQTEFFFPLDADDYLMPDALKFAMNSYPGDGFLYGSTIIFNEKQRTTYKAHPYDICKLLDAVYWPNGCLQKTENYHAIHGWDESLVLYEDWDYWLRSAEAGITGHAIQEVLYCYRQNPNGIIQTLKRNPDMALRARQMIMTRHPDLFSGVHPMSSCCGGGKNKMAKKVAESKKTVKSEVVRTAIAPAVASGLVLLTYLGGGLARSFYGASGTLYRFSSTSRKTGYVAEEDVPGLLAMKEHGKHIFSK